MKKAVYLCAALLGSLIFFDSVAAQLNTKPYISSDPRRQIPVFFDHSWIGLSFGVKNTDYSNANLQADFTAQSFTNTIAAARLTVGHYFNPYFGFALSLMRGIHSVKAQGLGSGVPAQSIPESVFSVTVRPTIPLAKNLMLYFEGGAGFISRGGFSINQAVVLKNAVSLAPVFGGGVELNLGRNLYLDLDGFMTPSIRNQNQPRIIYAGLGLNYFLNRDPNSKTYSLSENWFPLNFLQVDYFNQNFFYWDVAKYVTPPRSLPIFFDGHIKLGQGGLLMYERNFFHTDKYFSLEWGASVGAWRSREDQQSFLTLSLFPELKVWLIRLTDFDFYFTYSLAGPSYISRVYIDGHNSGAHFTFQDFIGFGAFIGREKRFNINLKIVHYSNGNTLPENPGVCAPVMLGIGLSF